MLDITIKIELKTKNKIIQYSSVTYSWFFTKRTYITFENYIIDYYILHRTKNIHR